jgi:ubiquinol-cytochrome c reductase cytochrome b subunit
MRLYGVNGPAGFSERSAARFKARQFLGRCLLCAAVVCFVAGLPGTSVASRSDRAAGAQIFKDKGCEHCHGVDGVGTDKGPALTTVGKQMHKNEIERQIRDGGKQMPPFGDELSDDEMHKLVDYLAHKKKAPKPAPAS